MKRSGILYLVLSVCFVSAAWPQVLRSASSHNIIPRISQVPKQPGFPQLPQFPQRLGPTIAASASSGVTWVQCPPEAEGFGLPVQCGTLPVPLDRNNPNQGTIDIYFELYMHYAPGPAESAMLFNIGGPGVTTTGLRSAALLFLGQNLDVHDMLLIDDRGRGLSETIDCEELQHGLAPWDQAMADCAAQLGSAASWYGTGDIAEDTEAVRAALSALAPFGYGYDLVDYYGISAGGADIAAYAARFGSHLRSIIGIAVGASPKVYTRPFVDDRFRARAKQRAVRMQCNHSPTCSPDHPFPESEYNALVWTIQLNPVEGYAHDANGNRQHVVMDESALLNYVLGVSLAGTGRYVSSGEILAAADSLLAGDKAPLLRLGAEGYYPMPGDSGDPTFWSFGADYATYCSDMAMPWDWSKRVPKRSKQFAAAVAALPYDYFAPFTKDVATGLLHSDERPCLYWEKPTPSSPVFSPDPKYPNAPALFLTGTMDRQVPYEEARQMAALFPASTVVTVAGVGHPWFDTWPQCAINLASSFIENLQVGDTSCAKTPETIWPALGRFPRLAKFALPAAIDPAGHNQIGKAERKVVTVAVATATDALQRTWINYDNGDGSGNGAGLRAGTFTTNFGDGSVWTTTLNNCAFSKDVTVNGTVTWVYNGALAADLVVSGQGTAGGTLHVEGTWQAPGQVGNFKVSGALGGKQVAALVPEA